MGFQMLSWTQDTPGAHSSKHIARSQTQAQTHDAPVLIVLFLISYGLMSTSGHRRFPRSMIKSLLSDS